MGGSVILSTKTTPVGPWVWRVEIETSNQADAMDIAKQHEPIPLCRCNEIDRTKCDCYRIGWLDGRQGKQL